MKDRAEKMRILVAKYGPWCPIAHTKGGQLMEPVTDLHHQHIHNTKPNRRRYPNLVDSMWNLIPVSNRYHVVFGSWSYGDRWPLHEADRREAFLARHKLICEALNRPSNCELSQKTLGMPVSFHVKPRASAR